MTEKVELPTKIEFLRFIWREEELTFEKPKKSRDTIRLATSTESSSTHDDAPAR